MCEGRAPVCGKDYVSSVTIVLILVLLSAAQFMLVFVGVTGGNNSCNDQFNGCTATTPTDINACSNAQSDCLIAGYNGAWANSAIVQTLTFGYTAALIVYIVIFTIKTCAPQRLQKVKLQPSRCHLSTVLTVAVLTVCLAFFGFAFAASFYSAGVCREQQSKCNRASATGPTTPCQSAYDDCLLSSDRGGIANSAVAQLIIFAMIGVFFAFAIVLILRNKDDVVEHHKVENVEQTEMEETRLSHEVEV